MTRAVVYFALVFGVGFLLGTVRLPARHRGSYYVLMLIVFAVMPWVVGGMRLEGDSCGKNASHH